MMAHTLDPSTQEGEIGEVWEFDASLLLYHVLDQPELFRETSE